MLPRSSTDLAESFRCARRQGTLLHYCAIHAMQGHVFRYVGNLLHGRVFCATKRGEMGGLASLKPGPNRAQWPMPNLRDDLDER